MALGRTLALATLPAGRRWLATTAGGVALAVLIGACGSSSLTLTEYVDELNDVVAEGNDRIRPLYADLATAAEPDLATVSGLFEEEAAIRAELQSSLADLDVPEQIAELHTALVDWHGALIEAQQSLARDVATAGSWRDFQESPEFAAFDEFMQEGLAGCLELQAALDATAARGTFSDAPWIPGELKEVVDAALGCESTLDE